MKFFYGTEDKYVDITKIVMEKMICGNQILILPNDSYREIIFSNFVNAKNKHILIVDDYENEKKYYYYDEIYLKLDSGKLNLNLQSDSNKNKKTILVTNARDEDNIEEWVIYHQKIGFDHIHIYDHNSIIPISKRVCKFENCTVTRIEGEINLLPKFKENLYNTHSISFSKNNGYEWMLYLDADEYLFLGEQKVDDFINDHKDYKMLKINWVLFTSNNHIKQPEGLVINNFTECYNKFNFHVKSFIKVSDYNINNKHKLLYLNNKYYCVNPRSIHSYNVNKYCCVSGNNTRDSLAELNNINKNIFPPYIAHYYCQSDEKLKQRKINRKRDDGSNIITVDFFLKSQPSDVKKIQNNEISNMYGKIVEEELAKYT
jgi:hypothetical protein